MANKYIGTTSYSTAISTDTLKLIGKGSLRATYLSLQNNPASMHHKRAICFESNTDGYWIGEKNPWKSGEMLQLQQLAE